MEKLVFLASIKEKLIELNLPENTVNNHVKIFEDCLTGKTDEEIGKIIESSGGIDGIISSIYNLENAKNNIQGAVVSEKKNEEGKAKDDSTVIDDIDTENKEQTVFESPVAEFEDTVVSDTVTEVGASLASNDENDTPTVEIEVVDNIDKHIKEAEEITNTLEHIPVPVNGQAEGDVEYGDELSEYDFEKLFEEKLTRPEKWAKKIREKLPSKAFWATLPLSLIIFAIFYAINIALFPVLIVSAILCAVLYLITLITGICFALVPIGYGVYMCFKSIPIALYELGIGITVLGITMFSSILLYNYVKRLTPFLFKQLKRLFKYNNKLSKRYFSKPVKEEL